MLNEGRLIHRTDRAYPLALLVGEESYELIERTLESVRGQLKVLQETVMDVPDPTDDSKTIHMNIVLRLLADGKWQRLCHGMIVFSASRGKNACNCLLCPPCHAQQRADVNTYWHTYNDRFNNERLGVYGSKTKGC